MSIIDAIPCKWKKLLKSQTLPVDLCNINENPTLCLKNFEKDLSLINSSDIYWKIISTFKDVATCISSWSSQLSLEIDVNEWKQIFTLYNKCTKDIKVRELQLKIIHRFYPCQSLISKWDKTQSEECRYCTNMKADIIHTFYECEICLAFWESLNNWLKNNGLLQLPLKKYEIILGFIPYRITTHAVNHIALYAKYYIHKRKKDDKRIDFIQFLWRYKCLLTIEKEIYCQNNEIISFNTIFGKVFKTLLSSTPTN